MGVKVGIDVGGTFTDFFLWSAEGQVATFKVLSTPEDPSVGVLEGLRAIAESRAESLEALARAMSAIVHGTTVTTNATLTRNGARTGVITTEGVRDALEMRRGIREEQYNNRYRNVVPLVPRHRRLPVRGRLDYAGREIVPLDPGDVRSAARRLGQERVEAVAVCFMNAFANPAHEEAAAEIIRRELPGVHLSVSSRLLPSIRFYNRVSTTVLNAYIGPVLQGYINSLTTKLADVGFGGILLIMQSNGGVALPEVILDRPATTLLSGPAAGPRAAVAFARAHGRENCILIDMGGTSFDASLVRDGAAEMNTEGEIERLRIALPMLAITTIGAGGGSIGWIDEGGLLRMGPQSAGALPGPACYGRGGERPTCTDASVVLGYLDPSFFAGGKLKLDAAAAERAIAEKIARPLNMSVEDAAAGMHRVINTNMAHGVRRITVERGLDPREFPLVVAGGAGPLHACMIARELDIATLIVPRIASILCASGMLMSDLVHDDVRSYVVALRQLDKVRLLELIDSMIARGKEELRREGVPESQAVHEASLDIRYVKQYHEVTVPFRRESLIAGDLESGAGAFHAEHNRLYGYDLAAEGTDLELINVRVRTTGRTDKPTLPRIGEGGPDPAAALKGRRRAYVPERREFATIPVYDGARLLSGAVVRGPALIEQVDATLLVSSSFVARVDSLGSYVLTANSVEM